MLSIAYTNSYKRDVRRLKKQGKDVTKLTVALDLLARQELMPARYRDHALSGSLAGYRECHIEGDWLLVYSIDHDELMLLAVTTGSHSYVLGI